MILHQDKRHQTELTTAHAGVAALPDFTLFSDPRPDWRGFFVGYPFYFGFFGYRQTPTRAGAPMMPE